MPALSVHGTEPHPLICVECEEEATGRARGWRAYVAHGGDEEPAEVLVYCGACAAREFDA